MDQLGLGIDELNTLHTFEDFTEKLVQELKRSRSPVGCTIPPIQGLFDLLYLCFGVESV